MIIAYVSSSGELPFHGLTDQHVTVEKLPNLGRFVEFYEQPQNRDIALIYEVNEAEQVKQLRELPFKQNIFIVIVGPADPNISLLAGKLGADAYISRDDLDLGKIKELIINSRKNLKERSGKSNVSIFTGIHGGIGTTTVAMHVASLLARQHPEHKVLFIDLAYTRAVSNLFFNTPHPEKTLADVAVNDYSSPELLPEILVKHDKNFFFVPGIQKHADRQELEKPDNIRRIIEFVEFAKQYFNDIVVDAGVFEDVQLKNSLSEFADSLYVIVEFSIPSISILRTQLDVVYRYGWAPKTHLLVNRYDAQGTFDVEEAIRIIRQNELYPYKIEYMLPNDSKNLREAWNEATLLTVLFPDTPFMKSLTEFVETHLYMQDSVLLNIPSTKQPMNGLSKKLLNWFALSKR